MCPYASTCFSYSESCVDILAPLSAESTAMPLHRRPITSAQADVRDMNRGLLAKIPILKEGNHREDAGTKYRIENQWRVGPFLNVLDVL